MTPEQYAESLIKRYQSDWYADRAIKTAISDVQHTIEAFKNLIKRSPFDISPYLTGQINYYQQSLTYLQNKLK